ncbi:cytochrome b-c1 complex subunit 7-like [Olea europaea subsp. europaea]|uniref:Cytochrome b-c1 complex subunit 7-like n=1 Tax=Olea europaea subsp. europaea TaxID=158383 RepID=A0A8S0ULB0_OLEEU|nr:cytochrome b-c1 complex subunit 7-like [Olea europaea subsp. europaea]
MAFLIPRILSKRSEAAARHFFKMDAYNKYGLYHDDLIGGYNNTVNPNVAEAYRRLLIDKPDQHDLRVYRALRANQLKIRKEILPEEEWTTFEEDVEKGHYLQPYLRQIEEEDKEKRDFMLLDAE